MKKVFRALVATSLAALLSGCYVNLAGPSPNLAVKQDAESFDRVGESVCQGVLWLFYTGDCSVDTAMKNGKITKVHHVDGKAKVILFGAYSELVVQVRGQ